MASRTSPARAEIRRTRARARGKNLRDFDQCELFNAEVRDDVEMQRRAHRESASRHVEKRRRRELEIAMRPVDPPVVGRADQAALF